MNDSGPPSQFPPGHPMNDSGPPPQFPAGHPMNSGPAEGMNTGAFPPGHPMNSATAPAPAPSPRSLQDRYPEYPQQQQQQQQQYGGGAYSGGNDFPNQMHSGGGGYGSTQSGDPYLQYSGGGGSSNSGPPPDALSLAILATLPPSQLQTLQLTGAAIAALGVFQLMVFGSASMPMLFATLTCGGSLVFASWLWAWSNLCSKGSAAMNKVSDDIRIAADGFLKVQYGAIANMAAVTAVVLFLVYIFRQVDSKLKVSAFQLAFFTSFAFLLGAACSAFAGFLGVWTSVRVNIRVAAAAAEGSSSRALKLAFFGGAISAILSAALCILGITLLYTIGNMVFVSWFGMDYAKFPIVLAGYGFGASFVALFMQLGGGIYTKAADVGADMIGKVESNIPEDDPRNPAVIADLVGDNVGDCAGSMADVFESIACEIIGTMILAGALIDEAGIGELGSGFIFFPLVVHACDLIVSSAGMLVVRVATDRDAENPLSLMKKAYGLSMLLAMVIFAIICRLMLYVEAYPSAWYYLTAAGWVGMLAAYLLMLSTQYYTDYAFEPVQRIARASVTGHGTNVIAGMSVGMESTAIPVLIISAAILTANGLGRCTGLPPATAGLFGTAVATMGMLCTAVFILAMNNFGPIADNAGGIVEMSGQSEEVRNITDKLDAVGNVTKAATKGYAVGGSALACFVLFRAYLDEVGAFTGQPFDVVNIAKVEVIVGGLLGIMMIFLFSGWAMAAVGTTAEAVVQNVREQFRLKPGIMTYTDKPDHQACVAIVTQAALVEMRKPALLALGMPVVVGLVFKFYGQYTDQPLLGVEVLAGMLMFGTLTALLMAGFFDNSGGAWDNAKKYIETGQFGGKGSEAHKASVTGDTVGDPFKDTVGPSLHVVITTMSTTILVLGPMFL